MEKETEEEETFKRLVKEVNRNQRVLRGRRELDLSRVRGGKIVFPLLSIPLLLTVIFLWFASSISFKALFLFNSFIPSSQTVVYHSLAVHCVFFCFFLVFVCEVTVLLVSSATVERMAILCYAAL
ncbi:hypothetical protein BC829DRAFT_201585 [Chytridium lagenaria]|nr:hypothetical protein BC829DRAFT_201585 [Chytridium lagenaria]